MVLIAMGGVVVVVVVMIQYQGRFPHFYSIHKRGEWSTLEEVEVVVCVLVVVVVPICKLYGIIIIS